MSVIARQSGICPLCSTYIHKNQSRIVKLPYPIAPRGDGIRSADDGRHYHADGRSVGLYPRSWSHERCLPRFYSPPKYDRVRSSS